MYSGIFFSVPIILYETWAFIAPGLYSREKRYVLPLVVSSFFLFQLGAIFAFYVIFPLAFRFFLGFSGEFIRPLLSIKEYLAFVTRFLLISGIIFQTPILIFMLARFGIVNVQFLVAHRKYALLVVAICAAILTPPDFFSQILLAIPLIVLYEVGIVIARLFGKNVKE